MQNIMFCFVGTSIKSERMQHHRVVSSQYKRIASIIWNGEFILKHGYPMPRAKGLEPRRKFAYVSRTENHS